LSALSAEAVQIQKTDSSELELTEEELPVYTVQAKTYRVNVFRNGTAQVLSGEAVLLKSFVLEHGRAVKVLGNISQEKGNRITLREGDVQDRGDTTDFPEEDEEDAGALGDVTQAGAGEVKPPDLPGITLHFLPDTIEIEPRDFKKKKAKGHALPAAFNVSGVFGDEASGLKNLRDGREDALPANRICSRHIFAFYGWAGAYWPEIEVTYSNGSRAEIRGISGVSHYRIGSRDPYTSEKLKTARGYWALRDAQAQNRISIKIHPADEKRSLGPAPYYTVKSDVPKNMFFGDEPVVFNLNFARDYLVPGKWRLAWRMEDHRQRPNGKGEKGVNIEVDKLPEVSLDLKPREMGYHRVRLSMSRIDGKSAVRSHAFVFARVRLEKPELRALHGKVEGEMLWANILGMRGLRLCPSWSDTFKRYADDEGLIDWEKYRESFDRSMATARLGTLKSPVSFIGLEWSEDLDHWWRDKFPDPEERKEKVEEAKVRYLKGRAKLGKEFGVRAWEPINEPNLRMSPERYLRDLLKPQYPHIKEADPEANFLGGCICGLENHKWVRRLYELGGHEYFDGVSLHPYTGNGFQEIYRTELDSWWQILRDYNDLEHGLWLTESCWHRGWGYWDYAYDRFGGFRQSQALNAVRMHLNAEAMGIPRDRIYVFYLVQHGYNDMYLMYRTHPTSAAVSIQVMNECLRDARFVKEIPLPGKGHHFQLFRDETRTVAVAFTNGENAALDLVTDASEVELTDLMGNRKTVRPAGGKLRIAMSKDPTYMRIAPGKSIAPSHATLQVQPNLAVPTLGAKASASSVWLPGEKHKKRPLPVDAALCGDWTGYGGAGAWNGGRLGWQEDPKGVDQFPDWFEVKLAEPVPVSRVRVYHDYGAWERILRSYDVQVFADGDWKGVAEVRDNYYQDIFDHRFEPVMTDRVRILIRMVNSCLFESISWIKKLSNLRAVEVYAEPQGDAKAFFLQELPGRRAHHPGDDVELKFRVRNVRKTPLHADLRLLLPEGITAEVTSQIVALGPESEGSVTFRARFSEDAPEGICTVLAGLYEGDTLICPDYSPRVLVCKNPPPPPKPKPKKPAQKQDQEEEEEKPEEDEEERRGDALDVLLEAEEDKEEERPPKDIKQTRDPLREE